MDTDEAVAVLSDPTSAPDARYQAHADLVAAAAGGDAAAGAALEWLRWNRSGRTACDTP
ncbi:hypothetical protein [Saccharothrix algeriensis]|uniref:Uncharacterized protein n=1 Tax=Saccharothrix algeriensis TaxID=173560 RepID=A0A8T8HZM4_9PSEU|nr:hypothetical protein [Saccharothrix algeriensis]MBM7809528.1 hypothetical protein [Saccharothrix algeriensis]QTR03849.1 hypothetical protein J7S33_02100 [Saccharothrix algeriensis]